MYIINILKMSVRYAPQQYAYQPMPQTRIAYKTKKKMSPMMIMRIVLVCISLAAVIALIVVVVVKWKQFKEKLKPKNWWKTIKGWFT